ncbi:MAG: hypothetical protein QM783_15860 [Phycisphaerales bacterium]
MNDRIMDKYTNRAGPPHGDDGDPIDGLGCFGVLRGIRDRAPAIEFRRKTGAVLVVAYSYIEKMEFDPTAGMTIRSGATTIRIKGKHLAADIRPNMRLTTAFALQRLAWAQEMDKAALTLPGSEQVPVVESIDW